MRFIIVLCVAFFVLLPLSVMSEETASQSLSQLLEKIKNFENSENTEFKERLSRFTEQLNQQDKLLKQAKKDHANAQAHSKKLTKQFNNNEKKITELKEQLKIQSGNLGELFGVVKHIASDAKAKFENSFITPQYPTRLAVVDELAKGKVLPDVKQLSQLWFELQREMTASAEVTRFAAQVIDPRGQEMEKEIVRVGNFSAFLDDRYLVAQKSQPGFVELSRQPANLYTSKLVAFNENPQQFLPVAIDPSRGAILSVLTQSPNLKERIDQGGYVGYVIIALGVIGLLIALDRFITLLIIDRRVKRQQKSDKANLKNPLGRVLNVYENNRHLSVEALELKLDEEILRNMPPLERGITSIKVLAAVAPLLGLLGTVIGMIQTFQAITLFGTGDPKLMAGGISEALVTTMLGLIVAVPLILSHSVVNNRSRRLLKIMEEQSTGYVARHAQAVAG